MNWNYRIIRHRNGHHVYYGMHEAYYNEQGGLVYWTENPHWIEDDVNDFAVTLDRMRKAISEKTIDEDKEMAKWGEPLDKGEW